MTYALAATPTAPLAAPSPAAAAAIAALRQSACWSQALQDCVENRASSAPACATIRQGYTAPADRAAVDPVIESMPFCPEPEPDAWKMWIGVGAIGFVMGMFFGAHFGNG